MARNNMDTNNKTKEFNVSDKSQNKTHNKASDNTKSQNKTQNKTQNKAGRDCK